MNPTSPPLRYTDFIANQEEPEALPNEVAYSLSALTGQPHYLLHRALAAVNPPLEVSEEGVYLPLTALAAVANAAQELLAGEGSPA